jgi:hypothetical protein
VPAIVYGHALTKAHLEALSDENITTAFKKTGVVPFNPDVITETMLAPSHSSSMQSGLPVDLTSPVCVMSDMIHRYLACQVHASELDVDMEDIGQDSDSESSTILALLTPMRMALSDLGSTSLSHLVSHSPPQSSSEIPLFQPSTISPFRSYNQELLELEPRTDNEARLQQALEAAEDHDKRRKIAMVNMQGVTILQNIYVRKNNGHLQAHEGEWKKKGEGNRLFGDGMAKLLDDNDFFDNVVKLDEVAKKKREEKEE